VARNQPLETGQEIGASRALILFSLALCVAAGLVVALVQLGILHGVAKVN
jgi:hypothetical protein